MGTVTVKALAWPNNSKQPSNNFTMKTVACLLFFFCTLCPFSSGLKCLTCITNMGMDVNCEKGHASSQQCSADEDKCLVSYNRVPGNIVVSRKCCSDSDSLCKELDAPMGNGYGMWSKTCECNNCNDFDPSTGGSASCDEAADEAADEADEVDESDPSSNYGDGFVEGYWETDGSSILSVNITVLVLCVVVLCRWQF